MCDGHIHPHLSSGEEGPEVRPAVAHSVEAVQVTGLSLACNTSLASDVDQGGDKHVVPLDDGRPGDLLTGVHVGGIGGERRLLTYTLEIGHGEVREWGQAQAQPDSLQEGCVANGEVWIIMGDGG